MIRFCAHRTTRDSVRIALLQEEIDSLLGVKNSLFGSPQNRTRNAREADEHCQELNRSPILVGEFPVFFAVNGNLGYGEWFAIRLQTPPLSHVFPANCRRDLNSCQFSDSRETRFYPIFIWPDLEWFLGHLYAGRPKIPPKPRRHHLARR
jgi:hypothetical protein